MATKKKAVLEIGEGEIKRRSIAFRTGTLTYLDKLGRNRSKSVEKLVKFHKENSK